MISLPMNHGSGVAVLRFRYQTKHAQRLQIVCERDGRAAVEREFGHGYGLLFGVGFGADSLALVDAESDGMM